ncbi:MAG TPA: apolipoprotein N-acyltransferase, partial [Polyangiaceae bacterium]
MAVASGALYWSAFPPHALWPLAFVAWVPLLVAVRGRSTGRALFLGWLHGLTLFGAAPWLFDVARALADGDARVGALGAAAFVALHALRPALLCAALVRAERLGWGLPFAFPILHAASEAFFPAALPWYAASQVSAAPVFMQGAAWVGAIGVGALLAAVNALLATALLAARDGLSWRPPAFAAASVVVTMVVAGALHLHAIDARLATAEEARVALVQPNGERGGSSRDATLERALRLTRSLSEAPSLVVWPETVLPEALDGANLTAWWSRRVTRDGARPLPSPVVAGALVKHANEQRAISVTNSALLFDADGRAAGEYDKRHPVAFGERIPFGDRFPILARWFPRVGRIDAGATNASLAVGGHRVTPLICYEDLVPDLADEAAQGSDLLVNLTDDGWFGRSSAWEDHLAAARYRAVEHGRFLIRAGNQSGTAVIDPAGRLVQTIAPYTSGVLEAKVRWLPEGAPYER